MGGTVVPWTDVWCGLARCCVYILDRKGGVERTAGTAVGCALFVDGWVREDVNLG